MSNYEMYMRGRYAVVHLQPYWLMRPGGELSMGLLSHRSPLQRASGAADTAEVEFVAEIEFTA